MFRSLNGRRLWLVSVCVALGVVAFASQAAAQASIRGTVVDSAGKPVDGATVKIAGPNGHNYENTTNQRGEFAQIGMPSGTYKLTANKDKAEGEEQVTIRAGAPFRVNIMLIPGIAGMSAKEAIAKNAELKRVFEEGIAANKAGNNDAAIAKFNEAIAVNASCSECYYNLGVAQGAKKDYEKAEAAFKKAIELNANNSEAYMGLANIYNTQRKFDLAAAAGSKAAELGSVIGASGGGADALYNQGLIFWNAGKIAEAKGAFESAVKADANHAEAHYQLGMTLVNEGNMAGATAEFESYLKLAPTGPNAPQAKALVDQLKK